MDADRNLLFGVLALQADLIDRGQFVEACTLWGARKAVPLADLLVGRGWLLPDDRAHVDYLVERKLRKHGGDVSASLASFGDDVRHSLAGLPPTEAAATVEYQPAPCERYARTCLHATGGIGRVWLAHDCDLRRDVALKEIRPERAGDAGLRARFLQEARITGQLEHPGVVPVYELIRQPLVAQNVREVWPDGRVTWVSTTKMPLRDPQGTIIGTFGVSRDISDRKRVEELLRQTSAELARLRGAEGGRP